MADIKEAIKNSTNYNKGKPLSTFKLTTSKNDNQLEPNYFWILDFLENAGMGVQKVTDNFAASPGSGQFQDMAQRRGINQDKVSQIGGNINAVTKSLIQLIYDLREFEIRLLNYDRLKKSDGGKEYEAAMLALKQIWLDSVDVKKGHGAIHQMAAQGGYTTIRQLFMTANSLEDLEKMVKAGTANEQVRQVLAPRVAEFHDWLDFSEKELRRRFKIERSYLKSQVETLKLYTAWIGPYLKTAKELEQKGFEKNAALVSSFSTSLFELCILGKKKIDKLPDGIDNYTFKRDYYACVAVTFIFRGHFGQKGGNKGDYAYAFGGKLDMEFNSYVLHSEELELFEKELQKQAFDDGVGFFEDETQATLEVLKEDFEKYLNYEEEDEKSEKKKKKSEDVDPFTALFSGLGSLFKKKEKDEKKEFNSVKDLQKDNFIEKGVRSNAEKAAKGTAYAAYDVYKKVNRLASSPEGFDN